MLSKETENDLETLLSMEIKLRLLDAEGVDIPQAVSYTHLDVYKRQV